MYELEKPLLRTIFTHFDKLPPSEIEQSVILISLGNNKNLHERIIGAQIHHNDLSKLLSKLPLSPQITLINPSSHLLSPEIDLNFITLHYLMGTVQRAKFIFNISDSDTQVLPLKNLKLTLERFICLFKKDLTEMDIEVMVGSCGIVIEDVPEGTTQGIYQDRFLSKNGILEEGYIGKEYESVKTILARIVQRKQILVKKAKDRTPIVNDLKQLIQKLKYFPLKGKADVGRLTSKYQEYNKYELGNVWQGYFSDIYRNFISLVFSEECQAERKMLQFIKKLSQTESNKNKEIPLKSIQAKQARFENEPPQQIPRIASKPSQKKPLPSSFQESQRILNLCISLFSLSTLLDKVQPQKYLQFSKVAVNKILDCIYEYRGKGGEEIRQFFNRYFLIQPLFLNSQADQPNLVEKVKFIGTINLGKSCIQNIREIIKRLFIALQAEIQETLLHLPSSETTLALLSELATLAKQPVYQFITQRIIHKLQAFTADICFKLIDRTRTNQPKCLSYMLRYLRESSTLRLKHDAQKLSIFKQIIHTLLANPNTAGLGLRACKILPEYQICDQIIDYYESTLKIEPRTLRYMPPQQRQTLLNAHFDNYTNFLLRVGLSEKVRELAMACLSITHGFIDKEPFKIALVKSKSDRKQFNHFIEGVVQEEREVVIEGRLIDQIDAAFKRQSLI